MAKEKNSIKGELSKIVRKKVAAPYLEKLGVVANEKANINILEAIALAQVKKGLEGDLKAAMFIEQMLSDNQTESAPSFDVVVKVVGEENGD